MEESPRTRRNMPEDSSNYKASTISSREESPRTRRNTPEDSSNYKASLISSREESPRTRRNTLEDSSNYKAQYINMDLAKHKISNGWEESPKVRRNVQMSLDSHEEFEFTMSHIVIKDDLYEPAMEVAPADELFFRGQLLPLQHDPRLQLVHTLSGIRREHIEDSVDFQCTAEEEEISMKHAYQEAFPFARSTDEDGFLINSAYHEGLSTKCANEEGFVAQGGSNTIRSSRSDIGLDAFKNDSRSSSFRSQQSSYWGSGEKDSRDSSSSSRCSNGSSQDACFHGCAERKAAHYHKAMANASANTRLNTVVNANDKAECQAENSKLPLPASKVKKWSWKGLFTGLRKASKIWVDDRGDEHNQNASQRDINKQKRSGFGFPKTGQASRSMGGMERDENEGQISYGEVKKAGQQASSSRGKGLASEEYGRHVSNKYYMGSGGWRGINYYEGSNGGRPGKEKARMGIIAWNARESWQKWVKRPLYGKLSHNTHNKHMMSMSLHEDLHNYNMKAKSLSSTPLAKSPVRRADNVANNPEYGLASSSSKYMNVGFASCPASMRSSPHHSGVLAVVNKPPPSSSLHDLHTAIQGAIAHCKQSQTPNPP